MEHKHAALLRMAADNADQLFECDECEGGFTIRYVLQNDHYNWRPVKTTKKIKRWLWASQDGSISGSLMSYEEVNQDNVFLNIVSKWTIKLLWSETEFEENE